MISASGGGGQGGCTPAGCWRGAESCAVVLQTKRNSWCCWGDVLQARSCRLTVAHRAAKPAPKFQYNEVMFRSKSAAKVFWDAHSNCWAGFSLPYPCLTLPSSTTISVMFHMRPTRFKCFLCSPVIYAKSVPGFTNSSATLTLLASSLQVNQQSQRASLEADAVGRHRMLPPHVRLG